MAERLQKVLAHGGVASRRTAERLIADGRVAVNGTVVTQLGTRVDPAHDVVTLDGQIVVAPRQHTYLALNKPRGVVSTARDDRGRPTVVDLVPDDRRLFPVGRLDADSEGLVLLTDDGALAQRLTHPSFLVPKEYHALVRGPIGSAALEALRAGVELDEGRTAPTQVDVLRQDDQHSWVRMVLRQGWNRQVRRMLATEGYRVERLIRVRIGSLVLGDLPSGGWRRVTPAEIGIPQEREHDVGHHRDRRSSRRRQDHRGPPGR